jgi:hypothetical protein
MESFSWFHNVSSKAGVCYYNILACSVRRSAMFRVEIRRGKDKRRYITKRALTWLNLTLDRKVKSHK